MITWDIRQFYSRAWDIVRHQPRLWIAGLAVATLVVGGNSYRSSSSRSSSPNKQATSSADIRGPIGKVVNTIEPQTPTQLFVYRLTSTMLTPLRNVPIATYVILGSEIFILGLAVIVIAYIGSAWSRGLLIDAVNQAAEQQPISLSDAGKTGIKTLWTIIAIDTVPWLRVIGGIVGSSLIMLIWRMLKLPAMAVVIIVAVMLGCYLLWYSMQVLFAQIWAYRLAVLHHYPYAKAMHTGKMMTTGYKGKMLVLGLINSIVNGVINGILLAILGSGSLISILNAVMHPSFQSIIMAAIITLISLLIGLPMMKFKDSFIEAFTYTVWHQAYVAVCAAFQPAGETES